MSDVAVRADLAKVVYIIGDKRLVINRGTKDGVKIGDRFLVFGYGPELADPDTGAELGRLEIVRGQGRIIHVQPELATLRSVERQSRRGIARGRREASRLGWLLAGIEDGASEDGRDANAESEAAEELSFFAPELGDLAKPI